MAFLAHDNECCIWKVAAAEQPVCEWAFSTARCFLRPECFDDLLHSCALQRKLVAGDLLSSGFFARVCKEGLGYAELFCQGLWTIVDVDDGVDQTKLAND